MMKTDVDSVFFDTNVLVYANVLESPLHQIAIRTVQYHYNSGKEIWISRQVLREYMAVLTRPKLFIRPISFSIIAERVRFFQTYFQIAEENFHTTERLLSLIEEFNITGKQIYDANIVATMQVYGIQNLITNNADDFGKFSGIINILKLDECKY